MKHSFYLFTMVMILALSSCAESFVDSEILDSSFDKNTISVQTKSITSEQEKITLSDVYDYLTYRMKLSVDDIKDSYSYSLGEGAVIHIVNMKDGHWYVFSGRPTTAPILAEGDEDGLYLDGALTDHCVLWLESIKNHIVKSNKSETEEAKINQMIWLHTKRASTAANRESLRDMDDDTTDRVYEYIIDTLANTNISLTVTRWDQVQPCNNAVPMIRSSGERCVAGCSVIAMAQLMYYTHYTFGFPNTIYTSATCSSYSDDWPNYNFSLSNATTTSWDLMPQTLSGATINNQYLAALCSEIAYVSHTKYGLNTPNATSTGQTYGSTTPGMIKIALLFFGFDGIDYDDYDESTIINEINNDRPVICSGLASVSDSYGHTFIYDGYKHLNVKETEIIYDTLGNILEINYTYYQSFQWSVNTGGDEYLGHHALVDPNTYYAAYRIIFFGWE